MESLKEIARDCGFELAGVTPALPVSDAGLYRNWVDAGMAASMRYLTDYRAEVRTDPRLLLPSAQSIICVGKIYKQAEPPSHIAQYAVTRDYHERHESRFGKTRARTPRNFRRFRISKFR